MTDDTADILKVLHGKLAKALLERIESGEAKAADFAAAVRFLSDNGVKVEPGEDAAGGLKKELEKLLPFNPSKAALADKELV